MRVTIQCDSGPVVKFDSVAVVDTPFAITRLQDSMYWRVTHVSTGLAVWPAAWSDQDAAVRAVTEWWGKLAPWLKMLFTDGTLDDICRATKSWIRELHLTADCNIITKDIRDRNYPE